MKVTLVWNVIPCSKQTHANISEEHGAYFFTVFTFYVEIGGTAEASTIHTTLNYSQSYEAWGCLKIVHSYFPF